MMTVNSDREASHCQETTNYIFDLPFPDSDRITENSPPGNQLPTFCRDKQHLTSQWARAHPSPPRRAPSANSQTELPVRPCHHPPRDPPLPGRLRRQDRCRAARRRPQGRLWRKMKVRHGVSQHCRPFPLPRRRQGLSANYKAREQLSSETAPTRTCLPLLRPTCSQASPSACGR